MSSPSKAKPLPDGRKRDSGGANVRVILIVAVALAAFIAWSLLVPTNREAAPAAAPQDQAGAAKKISVAVEPLQSVAGERLTPSPVVSVLDARNQPAAGVKVALSLDGGALMDGSTAEVATDENGRATFGDLRIARAGAYRLSFSAPGFEQATSAEFVVRFGPPRRMEFVHEPGSGLKGKPVSGPPTVRVTDAAGNPVPGINVEVAAVAGAEETPVLSTIMTDNEGLAVFGDLVVPRASGELRLKFDARAAGVNDLMSTPFVLTNRS